MLKNLFLTVLIMIFFLQCSVAEKKEANFEAEVFYNIFPALIDTFHYDTRLNPSKIPEKISLDKNGDFIYQDTIRMEDIWASDSLEQTLLRADTTTRVIVVRDTLKELTKRDYITMNAWLGTDSIRYDSISTNSFFVIDQNKLVASDLRIEFHSASEFPSGADFWRKKYDFHLSAYFSFSRILLDKNKTHGLLHVSYTCDSNCGEGFLVYLKKVDKDWKIEKIEETWAI